MYSFNLFFKILSLIKSSIFKVNSLLPLIKKIVLFPWCSREIGKIPYLYISSIKFLPNSKSIIIVRFETGILRKLLNWIVYKF